MPVDLAALPAPAIIEELSHAEIRAELALELAALDPDLASGMTPADPLSKLLDISATRELNVRARVNDAARALLVSHSVGADLDALAAFKGVARLVVDPGDPVAAPPIPPTLEQDGPLRIRIAAAPEGYSVAGPHGAYVFFAMSASGNVADARATSPNPGEVVVAILSADNAGEASPALVAEVDLALNDDEIRPLTDEVSVIAAELVDYTLELEVYLYPGPEAAPIVAESQARAEAYALEQARLGRDVRLSAVMAAGHAPGVQRVVVVSPPADIVISDTQAARATSVSVVLGGTDE